MGAENFYSLESSAKVFHLEHEVKILRLKPERHVVALALIRSNLIH